MGFKSGGEGYMAAVKMGIDQYFKECQNRVKDGYIIAALTDEFFVGDWSDQKQNEKHNYDNADKDKNEKHIRDNADKVLEIRVFNEYRELKLMRSDISKDFLCRCIDDVKLSAAGYDLCYEDYYDEWQILDIDETKGRDARGCVTATGGGKYYLPPKETENAQIKVRYYLGRYKETGQVRVEDWRAVTFENGSKNTRG